MSRARRAFASRVNGRRSRGPTTVAGKERAARAALRHGLTVPVLKEPALAPQVDTLAREIEVSVIGAELDARRHQLTYAIAEPMIDLRRVRDAKLPLIAELQADPKKTVGLLKQLERLDRYERRAVARHKRAIRALIAAATRDAAEQSQSAEQSQAERTQARSAASS